MEFPLPSADKTHHVFDGSPIYEPRFLEVREFRFPGLAAVRDESGAYHIDFFGRPLYVERYESVGDFADSTAWVKLFKSRCLHNRGRGKVCKNNTCPTEQK